MSKTLLLHVDLESTGLDPVRDEILEIGWILTDQDLDVLAMGESVVDPGRETLPKLAANPFVLKMHKDNGLLDTLIRESLRKPDELPGEGVASLLFIEDGLIAALFRHTDRGDTVHLAGSGVAAFDQPFLRRHMPNLSRLLHYAPIDVGPSRRMWQWLTGSELTEDNEAKTHRAMDDVEGHLREARAIRDKLHTAWRIERPNVTMSDPEAPGLPDEVPE